MTGEVTEVAATPMPLHDPEDFAALVHEHQAMVFSIAQACLRDTSAAEEVAQDVFLEMHRRLADFASRDHLVRWLRRVASHRCIDRIRRREPVLALVDVKEPAAPPVGGDFLRDEALRLLVASLPPKPRMVVILRFQEDLSPTEIADVMEMPVRTVKSHLQRSIVLLREKLARRKIGDV